MNPFGGRCGAGLRFGVAAVAFWFVAAAVSAQPIVQSRGRDPRVQYRALTKSGPWDDRNYALSADDLRMLPPRDHEAKADIPAFFRVELRREFPHLMTHGPAQYPRAASQLFKIRHGGLMRDGKLPAKGEAGAIPPVNSEIQLNQLVGRDEVTVEINPAFPNRVVAGANGGPPGQEMYWSSDGGATWTVQGNLAGTCCDPTVGWSSDGTVAYAASLSDALGVNFYRSTDHGATWSAPLAVSGPGSDKEFLHVDLSPDSPYRDNVYLTYHRGNVMQFARSTDRGLSFEVSAFDAYPRGIGSDITTDREGRVYCFYPAFANRQIVQIRSTDGGATFETPRLVSPTLASFIYPIPATETRQAFLYVSAAADLSGGPHDGSVYLAWNDLNATTDPDPANNHSRIVVARTRNGGQTWQTSIPHSTTDVATVDRFHPWIAVDEVGAVHVAFYDTRHSPDRTGVDFYYTFSQNGGQTWEEPRRVSQATSSNLDDSQEWGDYNGLAVLGGTVIPAWTDNRSGPPNMKNVLVADVDNLAQEPTFLLSGAPLDQSVCRPGALADVAVDVSGVFGFAGPVTLDTTGLPAGFSANFSASPVVPPGQSLLSVSVGPAAPVGNHTFRIRGQSPGEGSKFLDVNVAVAAAVPSIPTLLTPPDGKQTAGFPNVTLRWQAIAGAETYRVQVSETADFSAIGIDESTTQPDLLATGLTQGTTYYWRAAAVNACGQGAFSPAFSFVAAGESILLVDQDDDAPDMLAFYTDTLDSLGASYAVRDYDDDGPPTADDMDDHETVIWFTGNRFDGPTPADLAELETFLAGGGRLLLSSQDLLFTLTEPYPAFVLDRLGVAGATQDVGGLGSVAGSAGGPFEGLGPIDLVFVGDDFTDDLTVGGTGVAAFQGSNGAVVATATAQAVYLAFPFEAVANNSSAAAIRASSSEARTLLIRAFAHMGVAVPVELSVFSLD